VSVEEGQRVVLPRSYPRITEAGYMWPLGPGCARMHSDGRMLRAAFLVAYVRCEADNDNGPRRPRPVA
jgi:hypothetical protein